MVGGSTKDEKEGHVERIGRPREKECREKKDRDDDDHDEMTEMMVIVVR